RIFTTSASTSPRSMVGRKRWRRRSSSWWPRNRRGRRSGSPRRANCGVLAWSNGSFLADFLFGLVQRDLIRRDLLQLLRRQVDDVGGEHVLARVEEERPRRAPHKVLILVEAADVEGAVQLLAGSVLQRAVGGQRCFVAEGEAVEVALELDPFADGQ